MAYLPFYITPEEFAAEQAKQKQAIESGKNLKQWVKNDIEEPDPWIRRKLWCLPAGGAALIFGGMSYVMPETYALIINFLVWLLICYVGFITLAISDLYEYTLSENGLYYTKRRAEPTWLPKVLHIGAWFGVVGCVIAVVFIGPMALTGAGGCLLLSFVMVKNKYQPVVEEILSPSHQWLKARYHLKRKTIVVYSQHDVCNQSAPEGESYIWRANSLNELYLFFKTKADLLESLKLIEAVGLDCEKSSNVKELFEPNLFPDSILDHPIVAISYPRDKLDNRRDQAPPAPTSTMRKNQEKVSRFNS